MNFLRYIVDKYYIATAFYIAFFAAIYLGLIQYYLPGYNDAIIEGTFFIALLTNILTISALYRKYKHDMFIINKYNANRRRYKRDMSIVRYNVNEGRYLKQIRKR